MLLATHGDAASFERVLAEHGNDVAAVFVEPVMGTAGIFAPPAEFLPAVQRLARAAGALFVLDEVIMFRLAAGGAQSLYDVHPDLTTFGKLIGGGFPVGAVGGRADLMALTDPTRNGYRCSGTFNGNLMTMTAGAVAVRDLTQERIDTMGRHATSIARGVEQAAAKVGLPVSVNHVGSLIQIFLSATRPVAGQQRTDVAAIAKFHLACLTHGLLVSPRGFICACTAFTDELVDDIVIRITRAMTDVAAEV